MLGTDPFYIAIKTKEIEDPVCIHLQWVQSMQHDDRRLARRRRKASITWPLSSPTTLSDWWTYTATFIG